MSFAIFKIGKKGEDFTKNILKERANLPFRSTSFWRMFMTPKDAVELIRSKIKKVALLGRQSRNHSVG